MTISNGEGSRMMPEDDDFESGDTSGFDAFAARGRVDQDAVDAGVAHLQVAATEALKAARLLLDAAERIVADPDALKALVGNVGSMARTATEAVAAMAADGFAPTRPTQSPRSADPTDPPDHPFHGATDGAGYQRIQVD